MTTPNQPRPDGAYIIGGGSDKFGSKTTEDQARSQFDFPQVTGANQLQLLKWALDRLPHDTLKPWQGFLNLFDDSFNDDPSGHILGAMGEKPILTAIQDLIASLQKTSDTLAGITAPGNVVLSPNFEIASVNRIPVGAPIFTYSTAQKALGSKSLQFTTTAGSQGVYLAPSQDTSIIDVQPGDIFDVGVKVRINTGNGPTGNLALILRWLNNGATISDVTGTTKLNSATDWESAFVDFTIAAAKAPANADGMQVFLTTDATTPASYNYYVDAAYVRENTQGQTIVDKIHEAIDGAAALQQQRADTISTKLKAGWAAIYDGLNGTTGTTSKLPADVATKADVVRTQANLGVSRGQDIVDGIVQAVDGGTATGAATSAAATKAKLQAAWGKLFDGLSGNAINTTTAATPANVHSAATTVKSNVRDTIDGIVQAIDGSSTTNNAPGVAKTKLMTAWANIYDGLSGNTINTTSAAVPSNVHGVGLTVRNNALNAKNDLQTTLNGIVQAVDGGSGTASGPADAKAKLQKAWGRILDGLNGDAVGTTTTTTPDAVHTAATTVRNNLRDTIDGIVQAVDGGSAANNAPSVAKARLQKAWGNIFDGMSGNAINTTASATPAQVHTASKTVKENIRDTIDAIVQAVDGGSAANNAPALAKTKLQKAWGRIIDGLNGDTIGTTTTATPDAIHAAASTVNSNITGTIDGISGGLSGDTVSGAAVSNALASLVNTFKTLSDHSKDIAALKVKKDSSVITGTTVSINFGDYADGAMPTDWDVQYTGAGTGNSIGITSGLACWTGGQNADRDAKIMWNKSGFEVTNSDYQILRGTMSTAPQIAPGGGTSPKFHAIGRVGTTTTTNDTFVWCRAKCTGLLTYQGEIGCTVGGTEHVWASSIPLTWSLDMTFKVGVGTNARQYQVWSGSTMVWQHTETGTTSTSGNTSTSPVQSTLGSSFRRWGAIAQIRGGTGGPKVSGKVGGASVADNYPVTKNGSIARMYRTGGSSTFTAGDTALTTWYDNVDYECLDIDADTTTGRFTITSGTPSKAYYIVGRMKFGGGVGAQSSLMCLQVSTNGGSSWTTIPGGSGANVINDSGVGGSWIQYLNAGDMVRLLARNNGSNVVNGMDGGANDTYFSIAAIG